MFMTEYRVTIGDINYGGHLGNDKALVIFQDARVHFLTALGFSERDIGDNAGIIMVESGVRYLREVFLHDELEVQIVVGAVQGKKLTLEYKVTRKPEHEKVLAGFTSFLAFDYQERRVVTLPKLFKEKLASC